MRVQHYLDVPFHDWPTQKRFILGTVRRGRDCWAGFEGPEGSGKTTNAATVALDVSPGFDLEKHAIFNVDQLLEALDRGLKRQIYFLDEAANIFYNRDWNTWESKELTRIGRQMRIMESFWCVIMPDLVALDPYLREERLLMRNYQPPYYDADGMTNGPSKMMFRTERFDYSENARVKRWMDVYDYESHDLSGYPGWSGYNDRKEANFRELVKAARRRRDDEAKKEARKAAKDAGTPAPARKRGKARRTRASPPTTT